MIMIKLHNHVSSHSCTKPNDFLTLYRMFTNRDTGEQPPDTEMWEENSFRVTGIEEAGLGIVSTRRILSGEIILQEKPLLLVESKIKENAYTWFDSYSNDGSAISTTSYQGRKDCLPQS